MKNTKIKLIITIYILGSIISFGHCWSKSKWTSVEITNGGQFLGSVCAAILWPYYVSIRMWEK
jgi:hypothetical protein